MADLDDIRRLVAGDHGLCTVSFVLAQEGSAGLVHSSVVNAGVLDHPVDGSAVVGFVVRGDSRKLRHFRSDPRATLSFRVSWDWAAVAGEVDLIGPADAHAGFDLAGVPRLLRDVFMAAGGTHDDWDTYDRVMAEESRTAVLLRPRRFFGRGG